MIHLPHSGYMLSLDIERAQLVAANNGVFLRITTRASEISPGFFAPIRETARRNENRWRIDGANCNLSCRNVEFITVGRRPLTTSLVVDVYLPLNYALDVSFQQYQPSDGVFTEVFSGRAAIAERQTGAFATPASPTGRARNHRPVAVANIPRQMRELVDNELVDTQTVDVEATTLNAPTKVVVVPAITEVLPPPPEPTFLRRFDRLVPDAEIEE